MNKLGVFNCPLVKKNNYVEFIYNCGYIEDYNYKCRAVGKVIYVDDDNRILVELPQNFKEIGDIKGWLSSNQLEKMYGCCKNKLYWWVSTYRKIENILKIE